MELPDILAIASTWSFWDGVVPSSVPRRVTLPSVLNDSIVLVVQGVRRCGKSTLLRQLIARYRLRPAHCAFLSLEDPRLANALSWEILDKLVTAFRARHPRVKRLYFFLDEIQAVEGWERWLRSQLDRPQGNCFVITGSNATLLSGELATTMTGRHVVTELYPFDLDEAIIAQPRLTLGGFLHRGGFPAAVSSSDGDMLLRQYFQDIISRDVLERVSARSIQPLLQVAQMAFESAGSELSLRRIAGAAGLAVETADVYLAAFESAYLLFSVPWFAFSERQRSHRPRKYYPVDTGLRRVAVTAGGADLGKSLECATHLALRRRFGQVFYWRDKGEVDFVVQRGGRLLPVQVTWDEAQPRHHNALTEFYERFPQADEAVFVTRKTFAQLDAL